MIKLQQPSMASTRRVLVSSIPLTLPGQTSTFLTPGLFVRSFHAGHPLWGSSPLFHLAGLSNARETQHFSKASGLSRVEHSPNLQLIRSSEVKPFETVHKTAISSAREPVGKHDKSYPKTSSASTATAADAAGWTGWGAVATSGQNAEFSGERIARMENAMRELQRTSAQEQTKQTQLMRDLTNTKSRRRSSLASFVSFILGCVATTVFFPAILDVYGLELTSKAPKDGSNMVISQQHSDEDSEPERALLVGPDEAMSAPDPGYLKVASAVIVPEEPTASKFMDSDVGAFASETALLAAAPTSPQRGKRFSWQSLFWSET